MRRREFLSQTLFIPVAGAIIAVLVSACSDEGGSDGTETTDATTTEDSSPSTSDDGTTAASCSDADVTIGGNHGHSLDVTSAQIEAGVALSLTLSGPHTHTLALTAEEVAAIAACGTVVATATGSGHTHQVTLAGIS